MKTTISHETRMICERKAFWFFSCRALKKALFH
jgi:hypothetical protein